MKNYQWDAEDYELHSESQHTWGKELISKLRLKSYEHVLDIGCGDGKLTAEIAHIVKEGTVIGIDNSEAMIMLAKKRYPSAMHPNLEFRILDAQSLDYRQKFNVVFSNAVLHWIDGHFALLQRIYACLLPGGRSLLQMGGKGNAAGILKVLSDLMAGTTWKAYFGDFKFSYHFYSPEEYSIWINQTGFIISRIDLINKNMIHKDGASLEGWIRTTWLPYLQPIPGKLRQKFISQIVNRYLEEYPPDESGNITVEMVRLEVELVKP